MFQFILLTILMYGLLNFICKILAFNDKNPKNMWAAARPKELNCDASFVMGRIQMELILTDKTRFYVHFVVLYRVRNNKKDNTS